VDTHELAWAAGFFDGEGSIGHYPMRVDGRPSIRISISQVEAEPLLRFHRAVGHLGAVGGPYAKRPPSRPQHRFSSASFEHVQAIVAMIWPWLSSVKRAQASMALRDHAEWRAANPRPARNAYGHHQVHGRPVKRLVRHVKERCIHGHPFTEENTYTRPSDGARVCKTCRREQMARYIRKVG
jgi:hypothetical protein